MLGNECEEGGQARCRSMPAQQLLSCARRPCMTVCCVLGYVCCCAMLLGCALCTGEVPLLRELRVREGGRDDAEVAGLRGEPELLAGVNDPRGCRQRLR
eukprot:COSAG06_NODE_1024_length_11038_cov_245.122406_11_plen_99_part_00